MQKADQIFQPVLENSVKTEKARATLGVFERSKFLFNLPGALRESIAIGRYDAALRDYKKGKFLLESRSSQLLPSTSGGKDGKEAEVHHRRIMEKVWQQVEKVMEELRAQLTEKLANATLTSGTGKVTDEHERTIEWVDVRRSFLARGSEHK
jgi:exocyst complex component 2